MKHTSLIILSILIILSGCSKEIPGQELLDKAKLFMEGDSLTAPDTLKAIDSFKLSAEAGNAEAQYYMGYYTQHGVGLERNIEKAMDWYKKSAENDHLPAMNKIAMSYYNGRIVKRDLNEAREWFVKAGDKGYSQSQYMLGILYSRGRGVEKDTSLAIDWLRKSVKNSEHPFPEYLLGKLLYESARTDEQIEEARKWIKISAEKGFDHALELLEEIENK